MLGSILPQDPVQAAPPLLDGPTEDEARTTHQIAALWLQCMPLLMHRLMSALREAGGEAPISSTQGRILKFLMLQPRATRELAQLLGLSPATISAAVDSLVRRGLVERGEGSSDRRIVPLHVTPRGEETYRAAQEMTTATLAKLVEKMDVDDRRCLAKGLQSVARILEEI